MTYVLREHPPMSGLRRLAYARVWLFLAGLVALALPAFVASGLVNAGSVALVRRSRALATSPLEPIPPPRVSGRADRDLATAEADFRAAVLLDPGHGPGFRQLGLTYLLEGNVRSAQDALQKGSTLIPSDRVAAFALASAAYRQGDVATALDIWSSVEAMEGLMVFGQAAREHSQWDRARQYFALAAQVGRPDRAHSGEVLLQVAVTDESAGRTDAAIQEYQAALATGVRAPEGAAHLGALLAGEQRYDEAVRALRQALEWGPSYLYYVAELARVYTLAGRYQEADDLLASAIRARADQGLLYVRRAQNFISWGRPSDARRELAKLASLDLDANEWLEVAWTHTQLGNTGEAVTAYKAAVQLAPSDSAARIALAQALERANDPAAALVQYRAALRLDPANSYARDRIPALEASGVSSR